MDVEDEGENEERRAAAAAAALAQELKRRSAALQRHPPLPRPLVLDEDAIAPPVGAAARGPGGELLLAAGLVADEVLALLKHDAVKYPVRWLHAAVVVGCDLAGMVPAP
jgi:hypothetical protein